VESVVIVLASNVSFSILQFFSPLNPVLVTIQYNEEGRPSGEADVDFSSHQEANMAMKKQKALMGILWI